MLRHLQIANLGKKTAPNKEYKGELPAIVTKRNGENQYAAVIWDSENSRYRITFDPAIGMSTKIQCVFVQEEADIPEKTEETASRKKPSGASTAQRTPRKATKRK